MYSSREALIEVEVVEHLDQLAAARAAGLVGPQVDHPVRRARLVAEQVAQERAHDRAYEGAHAGDEEAGGPLEGLAEQADPDDAAQRAADRALERLGGQDLARQAAAEEGREAGPGPRLPPGVAPVEVLHDLHRVARLGQLGQEAARVLGADEVEQVLPEALQAQGLAQLGRQEGAGGRGCRRPEVGAVVLELLA